MERVEGSVEKTEGVNLLHGGMLTEAPPSALSNISYAIVHTHMQA